MTTAVPAAVAWSEANQRFLAGEVRRIRTLLEWHVGGEAIPEAPLARAAMEHEAPAALDVLAAAFGLGPFERDVLLLAAAAELDGAVAGLCAAASGDARRAQPTFGLALAALPDAHWSALSPAGPLRHWRLVELGAGEGVTAAPLRIDERVLHYLTGIQHLDERLVVVTQPFGAVPPPAPSHAALVERLAVLLAGARSGAAPCVNLHGPAAPALDAVVVAACRSLGLTPYLLRAADVPASPVERAALVRVWEREAVLGGAVLVLDRREALVQETGDAAAAALLDGTAGVVLVTSRGAWTAARRPVVQLEVPYPTAAERRDTLRAALNGAGGASGQTIDAVAEHFRLDAGAVGAVTAALAEDAGVADPSAALWDLCRAQARPRLDDLAARVTARAAWDDLVLPRAQLDLLRHVVLHVRHRTRVYEAWGFGARSARGLGITTLFAGQSGTGKTMAAEVLANELRLDLYRIDLSQVVSKYIGETEKNLRRIFDAAEAGGAILFFDEADALFGKRSEVKDSHDRYANIEVSYLLQRMEEYSGLAILTTNLKTALDPAFLRRLRFVVQFPFPGVAERAEIWRRAFPDPMPTEGLDFERLARLDVAGGNIRNIALHAAFLAAAADEPLRMTHLLRAARDECSKLERALSESEVTGWA